MTPSRGSGCPSGKLIFGKERLANRAVTNAAKRGELPPMKHYRCDLCNHWHLARKNGRQSVATR